MDINELTLGQVREIQGMCSTANGFSTQCAFQRFSKKRVFIRTVTMYYTGFLEVITPGELVLTECSWVADTGTFSVALETGKLSEVEPFPVGQVIVPKGTVLDVSEWKHSLPREKI